MMGGRAFLYLDDILFIAESRQLLVTHMTSAIRHLIQAGFIIDLKKSNLTPTQDIVFLGARIQTVQGKISMPTDKAERIVALVRKFSAGQTYTA